MSKYPNISEETAALQRREAMETRPQDRYAGRRKFTGCRRCGSQDGMQAVHQETLAKAIPAVSWYKEPGNAECAFHPCPHCNHWRIIPDGYTHMSLDDISVWLNRDPTAPDYAALAAEEPVLASEDARDCAGLEG